MRDRHHIFLVPGFFGSHLHDLDPPHFDWLPTGTGFDRAQFDRVWSRVLDFMLAPAPGKSR